MALASAAEVADVVKVAVDAAGDLGRVRRSAAGSPMLFRLRELLDGHRDDLAAIITSEHGKVLDDALGEVARGIECVEFACGIPHLLEGLASARRSSTGVDVHTVLAAGRGRGRHHAVQLPGDGAALDAGERPRLRQRVHPQAVGEGPVGVAPAGRAGARSRVPRRRVQRRPGRRRGGRRAADPPDVDAVSFVGSTPVARHVYETGTNHGKRVQALGGAKNHMVVLPDADVDAAADAAISAAYGSAGERCMAISVVVAVGAVADPLVDAIAARIPDVVVGPGDDPASMMGPLITAEHRDRVRSYVERAADEGARVVADGVGAGGRRRVLRRLLAPRRRRAGHEGLRRRDLRTGAERGAGRRPTTTRSRSSTPTRTATASPCSPATAAPPARFEREVEVGMIGINVPIPVPVAWHSFGGWKASIFGDSAMYGPEGVRFYTRPKVVTTRWPDPASSAIDLGFPTHR